MACIVQCKCLWKLLSGKMASNAWCKCLWKLHCDYTAMTVALFSNVCKDISVLQHSCLVIIHLFIKCHCKIAWNMYGNRKYLFRNKGYCYVYTWEGVTRGQLRPIDLKSSIIYYLLSIDGIVELVVATCWMDFLARQWIQMSISWFISGLAVWYKTKFGSQNFGYQNW